MAGAQCCENPPALNPTSGGGHVEDIGGVKCYVSGASTSKLAVLLISDVFGYEAPNLRKLADKVAGSGYFVVVPDFFHGDPYSRDNPDRPLPVWLKDHGTDKGFEQAKPVIQALKEKGVSKIGAAGFCWGAKAVVLFAQSDHIQAAVLLHPSFVAVDDIKGVKAPIAILGAETDQMSPPELVKQFEEILKSKPEVPAFTKIFPGVAHGWTVRYNIEDAAAVKSAEEAHRDMLAWLSKHIHKRKMAGPQCCENSPALNPTSGRGHVEEVGGLKCYVSGPCTSKLAVLLVSDVFGYEAPNLRKVADKVAGAGFFVVAPDFFHGDPFSPDKVDQPFVWLKDHGTYEGYQEAKRVIQALKEKGVSKIGAAGFCWGGKVVVQLAQSDYIHAAVLLHPSLVTVDDIKGVKAPIAVLGAEFDHISPPELIRKFGEILDSKPKIEGFTKIFPGVKHGWTVRYNTKKTASVKSAEEAHQDMLAWLSKHIRLCDASKL